MATSSSPQFTYDVFVSFRGEDVRKNFMDHLFDDFKRKGVHAFRDDECIEKGEWISPELSMAIEQSRFLLVIFSENYASSSWCLGELLKILDCKKRENDKYEVRTIFYKVEPSVVRYQTGSYKEAMAKHEASNRTEVPRWKEALTLAANLSGCNLDDMTNGYESKFIHVISQEIFYKVNDGPLYVGDNLVGIDARVERMDLSRFVKSNKVCMIGICGIGGIGKTTMAKAIYNLLYKHFEGHSFCEDVKGMVKQHGLVHLQMKLLDDIMKVRDLKIQSVSEGISMMKRRVGAKKVLIILDDVDHYSQFDALALKPNWFGLGGMIVVTSRDRQLLNAHGVEEIYEVDLLHYDEALELFSMYAFSDKHPNKEFFELANRVVHYVKGLPLALKVLGQFLFGKTLEEWESELDKLRRSPNVDIQQVLHISYDGLDSDQRNIFLYVACFFKGEEKDYVKKILDACELSPATNLRVLIDKSLITIDGGRIQMHDLIKEMGCQIVREESEEPGRRSRLWHPTDVSDVLNKDKGTELVKGIALDISSFEVNICGKTFRKLTNLRILNLYCKLRNEIKVSTTSRRLEFLSNELRMLCWHGYPFQHLPKTFYPESLVVLDLSHSCIQQLSCGSKGLKKLTVLKLRHCRKLTRTPDFTEIPNLEKLLLEGCENLVGVHPSVGTLKRLLVLNLRNCRKLECFPNVTKLESLKYLILSSCSSIGRLPEDLGNMKALVKLHVDGTSIKQVPSSVFSLSNLQVLSFGQHKATQTKAWHTSLSSSLFSRKSHHPQALTLPSMLALRSLRKLNVSHCNISGDSLDNIVCLSFLEHLDMSGNDFASLPANFNKLSRLAYLRLDNCKNLQALPELPASIRIVYAPKCTSLKELAKQSTMPYSPASFNFRNCSKMVEERSMDSLITMLVPQGRVDPHWWIEMFLTGSRVPDWFTNHSLGDCIKVELPPRWCYEKFKGFALCAVVTPINPVTPATYSYIKCFVANFDGSLINSYPFLATIRSYPGSGEVCLYYTKSTPRWKEAKNHVLVSFQVNCTNLKVKQCGVRLAFIEVNPKEASMVVFCSLFSL